MAYHANMEKFIGNQVRYWKLQKEAIDSIDFKPESAKGTKPFVTISREYGAGAYMVAEKLIMILNEKYNHEHNWAAYDRNLLDRIANDMGLSESLAQTLTTNARNKMTELFQTTFSTFPPQVAVYRKLAEITRILAYNGHVVLAGRAANRITRDLSQGFHVRLVAPLNWRVRRLCELHNYHMKEAEQLIIEKDKEIDGFIREFVKFDNTDPHNYHMVINMEHITPDEAAEIIADAMKTNKLL
ncbi:MAG TPA: cytidylate kinase-like family protein [Spirochaetota bacterium]|nr:cytidylate kinase-like family protein [Spirochaetota bacterium]HPJ35156.1 cytidylate kinase-like family protein [Spirochaetota bacterium]